MWRKHACAAIAMVSVVVTLLALSACNDAERPGVQCTDEIGCVVIPAGAPVRIGVIQALSGKAVSLGTEQIRGVELALDARGGRIAGHDIVVQKEDTGCTSEGGSNAALKITSNPQTVAVIGTTCSIAAASAAKIVSNAGMVMISGNNSASFLTSIGGRRAPDWQSGFFRTANNEEHAGRAAAIYAFRKLGIRKAAAVNDGDIYTRGLTDGFENQFRLEGGEMVLSTTVNKGDEDMTPVLEAVRYTQAEILFFPLFQPEGNRVLLQARRTPGLEEIILMSDGALIESTFIADVSEHGKGMFFVGPTKAESPASIALQEKYERKFRTTPSTSYYLSAFDAANMLFSVIEKTGVREPDGTLRVGRQALRDALYSVRNYEGVTGMLNCDAFGDCALPRFNILRLDDPSKGLAGLEANIVYTYSPGGEG